MHIVCLQRAVPPSSPRCGRPQRRSTGAASHSWEVAGALLSLARRPTAAPYTPDPAIVPLPAMGRAEAKAVSRPARSHYGDGHYRHHDADSVRDDDDDEDEALAQWRAEREADSGSEAWSDDEDREGVNDEQGFVPADAATAHLSRAGEPASSETAEESIGINDTGRMGSAAASGEDHFAAGDAGEDALVMSELRSPSRLRHLRVTAPRLRPRSWRHGGLPTRAGRCGAGTPATQRQQRCRCWRPWARRRLCLMPPRSALPTGRRCLRAWLGATQRCALPPPG